MQFKISLLNADFSYPILPINYQYPLSSALYKIMSKGNKEYAEFLHETGYGKGYKLFTFSQINSLFKLKGDRLFLQSNELTFIVSFHLPQAMESFIKGLFQSETIDIADHTSKASFTVKSIESLPNPLQKYANNEIVSIPLRILSPIVAGSKNEKDNYYFLSPEDPLFPESLVYNWRNKVATCYDEGTAQTAILLLEIIPTKYPFKSRLMAIKADTAEGTKIRGWLNFTLKATGEKRFVELLVNAGAGVYNAMGCGCVEVNEYKKQNI